LICFHLLWPAIPHSFRAYRLNIAVATGSHQHATLFNYLVS